MRPLAIRRKVAFVLIVLLVLVEVGTLGLAYGPGRRCIIWRLPRPYSTWVAGGCGHVSLASGPVVDFLLEDPVNPDSTRWATRIEQPSPYVWLPSLRFYAGRTIGDTFDLSLPAWMIVLPCLAAQWVLYRRMPARPRAQHCPVCGYALCGNVSGRCPECGESVHAPDKTGPARPH
jgi:hypothetical protein